MVSETAWLPCLGCRRRARRPPQAREPRAWRPCASAGVTHHVVARRHSANRGLPARHQKRRRLRVTAAKKNPRQQLTARHAGESDGDVRRRSEVSDTVGAARVVADELPLVLVARPQAGLQLTSETANGAGGNQGGIEA